MIKWRNLHEVRSRCCDKPDRLCHLALQFETVSIDPAVLANATEQSNWRARRCTARRNFREINNGLTRIHNIVDLQISTSVTSTSLYLHTGMNHGEELIPLRPKGCYVRGSTARNSRAGKTDACRETITLVHSQPYNRSDSKFHVETYRSWQGALDARCRRSTGLVD